MPFELCALELRYQLAEALSQARTFRGFGHLPDDLWLERGIVAVLEARRYRPQLVVVRSTRGGWWFVGVQRDRPKALPSLSWPFLCAFASPERIEEAQRRLELEDR